MSDLLSVSGALSRILSGVQPTEPESVELRQAGDRILTAPLIATRTQPPFAASAMDGYAVRYEDIHELPCTLNLIGESAAGHGFDGSIGRNECVRIFTGAPVPDGADTIVIQENIRANGTEIEILQGENMGRYVRPAGMDFKRDDTFLGTGHQLNSSTLSLAAAMNFARLPVYRRPRVAIIATGDELVFPGDTPGPNQIVASNSFGVAEIIKQAGGEPVDLGIAKDALPSLEEKFAQAELADIVVTLGGASVGDHDLVNTALQKRGVTLDFWKLAMRPGKPVMFGQSNSGGVSQRFIGLPGNPVSSLVCTLIFVVPLIRKLTGRDPKLPRLPAKLTTPLEENDQREEYLRGTFTAVDGVYHATPFKVQDSSLLSLIAKANCLIIRPAHAPATGTGADYEIIEL